MKRLILAGAMAVAACAGAPDPASTSAQLDGDRVVLATFTADVDPADGTFVIRSAPTAAGRALQVLDGDVTVANKVAAGNPFFNVAQGTGRACTNGYVGNVWGATVTITNKLTDTILGGVYAEITSANPVTALQSCSSATAPSGLSATPGLWSYGQIAASGTGEKGWVFKYTTATRFSFSGRVVGVKITKGDWSGSPAVQRPVNFYYYAFNGVVDAGTYMAVANEPASAPYGIDFVDKTTGEYVSTVGTPAKVTAMAVGADRIWFATARYSNQFHIGYVNKDGTGSATYGTIAQNYEITSMVAHPGNPSTKVWTLRYDGSGTSYIAPYESGASLGITTSFSAAAYTMALGADGNLYVANNGGSQIMKFMIGDSAANLNNTGTGGCGNSPYVIVPGTGGKLYFNTYAGSTCSVQESDLTVTRVGGSSLAATARGFAVNSTGDRFWMSTGGSNEIYEMDTSGGNNNVLLFTKPNVWTLTLDSSGNLWTPTGDGFFKISP